MKRQGRRTLERRLAAMQLLAGGKSKSEIARTLGVTRRMVQVWAKEYEQGGAAALASEKPGPRSPFTDDEIRALVNEAEAQAGDGERPTLARVLKLAPSILGGEISRSALRRRLVGLGLWPL